MAASFPGAQPGFYHQKREGRRAAAGEALATHASAGALLAAAERCASLVLSRPERFEFPHGAGHRFNLQPQRSHRSARSVRAVDALSD